MAALAELGTGRPLQDLSITSDRKSSKDTWRKWTYRVTFSTPLFDDERFIWATAWELLILFFVLLVREFHLSSHLSLTSPLPECGHCVRFYFCTIARANVLFRSTVYGPHYFDGSFWC